MWDDGLSTSVVASLEDAHALTRDWDLLWDACPSATPFLSPDWVLGCWRYFLPRERRTLVVFRVQGKLIAIAPLRLRCDAHELEGREVSDYQDILVLPGWETAVVSCLLRLFDTNVSHPWTFERLERSSPLLRATLVSEISRSLEPHDVCPYLPIPRDVSALEQVVPHGFYLRIRQAQRVARRHFRVETRRATTTAEAQTFLEHLYSLHTLRWNAMGEPGVFSSDAIRNFHRQTTPQLLTKNLVLLQELRFDDEPVATTLAFRCRDRLLYYIGGFGTKFAKYSPGRLLLAELVESAISLGCREVDFLRGVERYKYDWGANNRHTYRVGFRRLPQSATPRCDAGI